MAHGESLPTTSAWAISSSAWPARRSVALSEPTTRSTAPLLGSLRELSLQRTARVVGVGRHARMTQTRHQRETFARGADVENKEDVEGGCRSGHTRILEREQEPLDAGAEAHARGRRTAQLGETVVAPGSRTGRWSSLLGADELPGRPRVVVEAADEGRDELVPDARGFEVGEHGGEMLTARLAERVPDGGRATKNLLHSRGLGGDVVKRGRSGLRLACSRVSSSSRLSVLLQPLTQSLDVGGSARGVADRV